MEAEPFSGRAELREGQTDLIRPFADDQEPTTDSREPKAEPTTYGLRRTTDM